MGPPLPRLPDRAFAAELVKRMGGMLGEVRLEGPRATYPLGFHHAAQITAERLALVGDAAHGIHPIAGQGLNLGFRDAAALAQVLVEGSRLGMDSGRCPAARALSALAQSGYAYGRRRHRQLDPIVRAARQGAPRRLRRAGARRGFARDCSARATCSWPKRGANRARCRVLLQGDDLGLASAILQRGRAARASSAIITGMPSRTGDRRNRPA